MFSWMWKKFFFILIFTICSFRFVAKKELRGKKLVFFNLGLIEFCLNLFLKITRKSFFLYFGRFFLLYLSVFFTVFFFFNSIFYWYWSIVDTSVLYGERLWQWWWRWRLQQRLSAFRSDTAFNRCCKKKWVKKCSKNSAVFEQVGALACMFFYFTKL